MDIIDGLEQWFAAQCDGEWEHQYGLSIDTLDNPGWAVSIDLFGTDLELASMGPYQKDNGEDDWVFCEIREGRFLGNGDPHKLAAILQVFLRLSQNKPTTALLDN